MTRVNLPSNRDDANVSTSTKVRKGSICVVNDLGGYGDSLLATRGRVVDGILVVVSLGRRS